ncbi:hypothetical protein V8E36_008280 [Tilletia maclaganii]
MARIASKGKARNNQQQRTKEAGRGQVDATSEGISNVNGTGSSGCYFSSSSICHLQRDQDRSCVPAQDSGPSSIGIVAILIDAFNTPLGIGDTLIPLSGEELESSQSLMGRLHQESRRNKSKRRAEISTSAASYIQTLEVKVHQLQADISTLRAPKAAPTPSISASYRKKTASLRSSTCSPCLTSGDHSAFFQADSQDLIDIPQRKDAC